MTPLGTPLLGEMGRATVLSRRECRSAAIWSDGLEVREVTVSRAVGWNIECLQPASRLAGTLALPVS